MRVLFIFFLFLSLFSCETNEAQNKTVKCEKTKIYGDIKICLPEIEGMLESFSNPKIKERSEMYSFDNNIILGVFVNKKDLNDLDNVLKNKGLDEYIKVWGLKKTENLEINNLMFNELKNYTESEFLNGSINWGEIKNKIKDRSLESSISFSVGKPVAIEFYQPNDKIITQIFLTKVLNETEDYISVFSLSMVKINNKLIQYSYAKKYTDPSVIGKVKANNDLFGYKIIAANRKN